jgi:glucose/arabinose dehydrogenase
MRRTPIVVLSTSLLFLLVLTPSTGAITGATPVSRLRRRTAQPLRYRVQLDKIARSVRWPTGIASAGDERLFVLQQRGYTRVLRPDGAFQAEAFLDIRDRVGWEDNRERGLLGLAFHPDYAANGYFYVTYIGKDGDLRLSRFRASDAARDRVLGDVRDHADPDSEFVILEIDEPEGDHNGGDVHFGPDGYLYLSIGDGGGHHSANAQHGGNVLGTILRLDVDSDVPYAVPPDNRFVGDASVRDETWLLGLRNPWRFSFDSATGDLFIGDVGGERFEEIDYPVPMQEEGSVRRQQTGLWPKPSFGRKST